MRIFFGRIPTGGGGPQVYERTVVDGMMFFDPTTKDNEKEMQEKLFLSSLRESGLDFLRGQDSLLLKSLRESGVDLLRMDNLFLSSSRESLFEFIRGDTLFLSELVEALKSSGGYEVTAIDSLLLRSDRTFEFSLLRLEYLFLAEVVEALKTSPGVNEYVVNEVDGVFLNDLKVFDLLKAYSDYLFLSSLPQRETERELTDKVFLGTSRVLREMELQVTDYPLFNEITNRLRELLWSEGLFVDEAVERLVIGAVVEHLVYARLQAVPFLGTKIGSKDFLGRTVGFTKWRMD